MGTLDSLFDRIRRRFKAIWFRKALVWLLMGLIPLQALGLVTAELRGPAHYHDRSWGELADPSVLPDETVGHVHTHSDVERHHHGSADEPILVDDASVHQHEAMAIDDGASGSGSLFSFAALLRHNLICGIADLGHVQSDRAQKVLDDRAVGRIDRPPEPVAG